MCSLLQSALGLKAEAKEKKRSYHSVEEGDLRGEDGPRRSAWEMLANTGDSGVSRGERGAHSAMPPTQERQETVPSGQWSPLDQWDGGIQGRGLPS